MMAGIASGSNGTCEIEYLKPAAAEERAASVGASRLALAATSAETHTPCCNRKAAFSESGTYISMRETPLGRRITGEVLSTQEKIVARRRADEPALRTREKPEERKIRLIVDSVVGATCKTTTGPKLNRS